MMKYQPVNLNFIPKDEKYNNIPLPDEKEMDLDQNQGQDQGIELIPQKDLKDSKDLKNLRNISEKETRGESSSPRREVFSLEEKMMMKSQIEHLREQLKHSENQVATLEVKLKNSNNSLHALKDQLTNYEVYKEDIEQVSTLNTSLEKLSKENESLKQELKQQKDHVQMLYLVLLILAIL